MASTTESRRAFGASSTILFACVILLVSMFATACGSETDAECRNSELHATYQGQTACYKKCTARTDCPNPNTDQCVVASGETKICVAGSSSNNTNNDPDVGGTDPDDTGVDPTPDTGTPDTDTDTGGPTPLPEPDTTPEDLELCEDYCHLIYGCLTTDCDGLDDGLIANVVRECVNGANGSVDGDWGCRGDLDGAQAATNRESFRGLVYVEDEDGNLTDEKNTCDFTEFIRCVYFEGLEEACSCTYPINLGDACESEEDCDAGSLIAACIEPVNSDGEETGFVDGYCLAVPCTFPRDTTQAGQAFTDSACGAGNACMAFNSSSGDGLVGQCFPVCSSQESCREGYSCQMLGVEIHPTTNDQIMIRSCLPQCQTPADCGSSSRCNETGVCEFPCNDDDARTFCSAAGGACIADEEAVEWCVLP